MLQYVKHGMPSRSAFHGKLLSTLAVRPDEFAHAFKRAWLPREPRKHEKLGLAVSGGVDSMALAILCRQFITSRWRDPWQLQFQPLIVDHKARDGSTEEAIMVANRLQTLLELKPKILTLQWPDGIRPSAIKNFESLARQLRYQALGRACLQHGINSLLLAHHEDDVAETILQRLAEGHKSIGLQGILSSANIPECVGIYGVHESGNPSTKNGQLESGGITIHRPLLSFPKARLIATCESAGINWAEDKTNHDPTVTLRNAVRNLLASEKLPEALKKPSLLRLASAVSAKTTRLESVASELYHCYHISSFDVRSGKMILNLPVAESIWEQIQGWSLDEKRCVASIFLRRILQAISPLEVVSLTSISSAVGAIFPQLTDPESRSPRLRPTTNFTCAGVHFRREKLLSKSDPSVQRDAQGNDRDLDLSDRDDTGPWILTRQPFHSGKIAAQILVPPFEGVRAMNSQKATSGPTFQLWDGRFWIRVENRSQHAVCIRNFRKDDIKSLRNQLQHRQMPFSHALKEAAAGDIRWTLPVIANVDGSKPNEGQSSVLALPSFGIVLPEWENLIRWDIRYKKIELGSGGNTSIVGQ